VFGLREEVTRVREAVATMEVARVEVVRVVATSAKASIEEVEARAFLAEKEARERVLKAEAEITASLAFIRGEA
jgi:hypothetical protein